jgi:DNA-binding MarR family transcriptional regulator
MSKAGGVSKARDDEFAVLADLVIDIAREIRIRGTVSGRSAPLTQTQSHVMRFVHNHPGCSSSAIASGTGLRRGNVSASLGELRALGFISSRRDGTDGRAIRIEPTKKALDMLGHLRSSWAELLSEAWGEDKAQDQAGLRPLSARLAKVMDALVESRGDAD